jgi:hypothetical protein
LLAVCQHYHLGQVKDYLTICYLSQPQ